MNIEYVREQRDMMLKATDKYMISDWPVSSAEQAAWAEYRQALRDITLLSEFSDENDFWPIPPRRYMCEGGHAINLPVDYVDQY